MTLVIRFIPNAARTVIRAASGRTYRVTGSRYSLSRRRHTSTCPRNQAHSRRHDCGSACQRSRQYQLAAARDVRHDARGADLYGAGLEPHEMGEHYGPGSLMTDGLPHRWVTLVCPPAAESAS